MRNWRVDYSFFSLFLFIRFLLSYFLLFVYSRKFRTHERTQTKRLKLSNNTKCRRMNIEIKANESNLKVINCFVISITFEHAMTSIYWKKRPYYISIVSSWRSAQQPYERWTTTRINKKGWFFFRRMSFFLCLLLSLNFTFFHVIVSSYCRILRILFLHSLAVIEIRNQLNDVFVSACMHSSNEIENFVFFFVFILLLWCK